MVCYYHKYDVRTGLGRRVNKNPIVNPFYRFVYIIVYKSRTKSAAGESEIGHIPLSFYNIYIYYFYNIQSTLYLNTIVLRYARIYKVVCAALCSHHVKNIIYFDLLDLVYTGIHNIVVIRCSA